ncbi:MAG TPA: TrkA family potassium uptake protein [Clostridiales bacterium]|mgnify:CR=1 FL=1|nr:TrkA family potassium uptake protein [Clostridiales bacterium]
MKSYLVLGLGRFGESLAKTLSKHGHDILAVDKNEDIVQQFSSEVTHAIVAESSNEEFLKSVGIKNFDAVIVAIGDIQSSILTTVLLKELGAKYVLAKASNELHAKVLYKVGVDKVVFPEKDMGIRAANSILYRNIIDVMELFPEYSIMEITVPSTWIGKTIRDLSVRSKFGVNIIALRKIQNLNVLPNADAKFDEGDILVVMGKNSDLKALQNLK